MNPIVLAAHLLRHGEACSAQAAAKIVDCRPFLAVLVCHDADHRNNSAITRYRAADHIIENTGDVVIKDEIASRSPRGK